MLDFSKLSRPKTADERRRDEDQRIARLIADDINRRREWSSATVAMILTRDAEHRYTASGGSSLRPEVPGVIGRSAQGQRNEMVDLVITTIDRCQAVRRKDPIP